MPARFAKRRSPCLPTSFAAFSATSLSPLRTAFWATWLTRRRKICWMIIRVALTAAAAPGDAAPAVSATATPRASSSPTKMPISIQISIFAASMSQPTSCTT